MTSPILPVNAFVELAVALFPMFIEDSEIVSGVPLAVFMPLYHTAKEEGVTIADPIKGVFTEMIPLVLTGPDEAANESGEGNEPAAYILNGAPVFPSRNVVAAALVVTDAAKNALNPVADVSVVFALNALTLAAGNVTAGRPLSVPMLNALLPALDVVLEPNPLLSSQTPVAMFVVCVESAPSNHKTQDEMEVGSDVVARVSSPHFHERYPSMAWRWPVVSTALYMRIS